MIYDCFLFNNELDLLEIRLNELNKVVDKFVLVESTKTFTLLNKPLYFKKNKFKYNNFLHKIIHLIIDDFTNIPDIRKLDYYKQDYYKNFNYAARSVECYQRNFINKGLFNCNKDDIILLSDLDEIPKPEKIQKLNKLLNTYQTIGFKQTLFYYYFNVKVFLDWIGTKATLYSSLKYPQQLRQLKSDFIIPNGGWHFSYLGGYEKIRYKMNSICHQELNTNYYINKNSLQFNINNDLDIFERPYKIKTISINNTYPKYILKNRNKFKKYIKSIKNNKDLKELRNEIFRLRCIIFNLNLDNKNHPKNINIIKRIIHSFMKLCNK